MMESFGNGRIKLILGDCREHTPRRIDSVVTDPPYGMGYQSNYRSREMWGRLSNDQDTDALVRACALPARHSNYVFCRWDNLIGLQRRPTSVITWVKNNWSMGDLNGEHARQTELILFYPGPKHAFPADRPRDVVYCNRTSNARHPTEKPVSLMCTVCAWTAGVIYDPYMGSGSTAVAAARLGREFVGVELNKDFFDTACKRVQAAVSQRWLV